MRNILLIVLVLNGLLFHSQNKSVINKKTPLQNNSQSQNPKTKYSSNAVQGFDGTKRDTCLNKQFSIVFYIVLDSNGTVTPPNTPSLGVGFTTPTIIDAFVDKLNEVFKPICVSFKSCSTVYIPNFEYGSPWKKGIHEPIVTGAWYTDQTINFYLVDTVAFPTGNPSAEYEGDTYQPLPANLPPLALKRDIIVLDKIKLLQQDQAPAMHLMGHFFGLKHTHDEIGTSPPATPGPPSGVDSNEFADGTNCKTHGDGLCDTEADPGSDFITQDGKGHFYIHPKDNYMSYYSTRNRFTQEQYNKMVYTILTKRLYLH